MRPKVSILVPIYNVSPFIKKCAESLFCQTFEDIEYIFVNDATPDDSIEKLQRVIDNYPERRDRITIIHHPSNLGLAMTRNTALEASTGSYIAVVDSDDFIEPDMIEALYNKAAYEKADIVVCDFKIEYSNYNKVSFEYISDNKAENLRNIIQHDLISSSLCNKLVKRNLYMRADCRVPKDLNYCEDWYVSTRIFYFASKIVKINKDFYHYTQYNTNAITKKISKMHFENTILFWNLLEDFLKNHNEFERLESVIKFQKLQSKVQLMFGTNSTQLRKEYANMFQTEEKHSMEQLKQGEKLMLYLIRHKQFWLTQIFRSYLLIKKKYKKNNK